MPPSTYSTWPLTKLEASLARNTAGPTRSSVVPHRAADVEDTDLPALQKILRAEVVPDVNALVDGHRLCSGHAPQRHHPVHMAVHRHHFVCRIQVLDQKLFARLLRCIALEVPLVA